MNEINSIQLGVLSISLTLFPFCDMRSIYPAHGILFIVVFLCYSPYNVCTGYWHTRVQKKGDPCMSKCKYCGCDLRPKAKFCTFCGKAAVPTTPLRMCSNPECQNHKDLKSFKIIENYCDLCASALTDGSD